MKFSKEFWIGTGITVLLAVIPYVYTYYNEISEVEVVQESSVTIIDKPVGVKELTLLYDSIPISNLHQTRYRITNNSNLPLVKEDFIKPIVLSLADSGRIIAYEVGESDPDNLDVNVELSNTNQELFIDFNLLNPDDYTTLDILSTGDDPSLSATARIKGIKDLVYTAYVKQNKKINQLGLIVALLGNLISVVTERFRNDRRKSRKALEDFKTFFGENREKNWPELNHKMEENFGHFKTSEFLLLKYRVSEDFENFQKLEFNYLVEKNLTEALFQNIKFNTDRIIIVLGISLSIVVFGMIIAFAPFYGTFQSIYNFLGV